jgi:hypothetical protein
MALPKPPILTPQQELAYSQQHQAANQSYNAGVAQNQFNTGQATAAYHQNLADLTTQLRKMRQSINPTFNARGMLRSGLFHRALSEDAASQLSQLAKLNLGQQTNLGNEGIQNQLLAAQMAQQQAQINAQRMAALNQLNLSMRVPGATS